MAASNPAPQRPPRTLMEAHKALVCIRPSRDAPLDQWQAYYHRSAVLYAEIAEMIGDIITRRCTGPSGN
jgi:hypothetical protein